jgi:hypothetical protein
MFFLDIFIVRPLSPAAAQAMRPTLTSYMIPEQIQDQTLKILIIKKRKPLQTSHRK